MQNYDMDSYKAYIAQILESYDDTLSTLDVAEVLGVSTMTILRWTEKQMLCFEKKGRNYIFAKKWVLDFIERHQEHPLLIIPFDRRLAMTKLAVLEFCQTPRSIHELLRFTGYCNKSHLRRYKLAPLQHDGLLILTIPHSPHDNRQKYIAI